MINACLSEVCVASWVNSSIFGGGGGGKFMLTFLPASVYFVFLDNIEELQSLRGKPMKWTFTEDRVSVNHDLNFTASGSKSQTHLPESPGNLDKKLWKLPRAEMPVWVPSDFFNES